MEHCVEHSLDEALAVCKALGRLGIWIELQPATQTLVLGPTALVRAHPDLLAQVREAKPRILEALAATLVAEVLTDPASGRFALEGCPACGQEVFVVAPPRRLAVHRQGNAVCPGAQRAQEAVAQTLMTQFLAARCLPRPGTVLTWMALRGGLEGWARDEGLLLPPRPYLVAWMDAHYQRFSADEAYPSWRGLTFTLHEWLGDDDAPVRERSAACR